MIVWLLSPFSPLPEPGAHESRTATLARALTDAGHQVVWFSMDWDHRRKEAVGDVVPDFAGEPGTRSPTMHTVAEPVPGSVSDCELGTSSPTIVLIPTPPYQTNISLRRFASHRLWGDRLVKRARRMVAAGELASPDLILASSPPLDAPRAAFRLQKEFGCRVKIDLTDLWPHTFERVFQCSSADSSEDSHRTSGWFPQVGAALLSPLYRQAYHHWRKADGISAMSREYLDEVERVAPDQVTHLCYIGGTVGEVVPDFAGELGTRSPTAFLYLGALSGSYDFDTLFAATAKLAAETCDFHIHIAGSGPLESRLQQTTDNLQLAPHVTFHGFLNAEAMHALIARCHVGLNLIRPGLHITMPHKLNDYLCAGLPVINSLRGEAEHLLDRYQAGVTYTAGDLESLAAVMRSFLDKKNAPQGGALKLAGELLDRKKTYPEWGKWICA